MPPPRPTITELRPTSSRLVGVYLQSIKAKAQVRTMFASHRYTSSLATRFVFGVVVVFVFTLICGLASHTAKAQVRIGIGVGGIGGAIGGVLLDDSYRKQKSQQGEQYQRSQSATETKKATKARNQKSKRDDSKIAKESSPKAKPPEPVASAPQTASLTAGPPPTPDTFGE